MNAGNGSMPHPDIQEALILRTEIYQLSTGIKTWMNITKQWDIITHACPKSNVEVKVSTIDSQ